MTNHKEILRFKSLGLSHADIAASCGCGRNTVTRTLQRASEHELTWEVARTLPPETVTARLFPGSSDKPTYRMPDYEHVHKEMQKSGVTLSLLWVEYCEECRAAGELPYPNNIFANFLQFFIVWRKTVSEV